MSAADRDRRVFLTLDDGPNEPYTSQALDVLARYGVRATFFVCGKNVERYPDVARRIVAAGHQIGNHAYSHSMLMMYAPNLAEEFFKTAKILHDVCGIDAAPVRAPWGRMLPSVRRRITAAGMRHYHWDVMAYDWLRPPASFIAGHILKRIRPGSVILLHDGKDVRGGDRSRTIAALPRIIEALQKDGYMFDTLPA